MNTCRWILTTLAVAAASMFALPFACAATLDRDYRMGDAAGEGAAIAAAVGSGNAFGTTFDSQGVSGQAQLIDLTPVNTPTYRSINALSRPDGGTGLAIEFNAAQSEYMRGSNLNDPFASVSHTHPDATLNYNQIFDRGLQFWVRPTSTAVQTLVMDSNQHGVRIDANMKFSMRYGGIANNFASDVTVVPNNWYHVEVVRPATFANGSRMFINGIAVAAAPGEYSTDASPLVVGSNTAGTDAAFTGGTTEYFSGIIDDLKLFVIGQAPICTACTPDRPAANYGPFNFATDNDFALDVLTGVPGDVDNSGSLTQVDKDAFIAGWMNKKVINGVQVGDLVTHGQGDLNFDGITDIRDLVVMQGALSGAGMGAITAADLLGGGVPEPSTGVLMLFSTFAMPLLGRHRRRSSR